MGGKWTADPTGRHQWRWWDGVRYTEYVVDGEQRGVDHVQNVVTFGRQRSAVWPWIVGTMLFIIMLCLLLVTLAYLSEPVSV